MSPGITFLNIRHDLDCPTIGPGGTPAACTCGDAVEFVFQTEDQFVATVKQSRMQRRISARTIAKAQRQARKSGGAR